MDRWFMKITTYTFLILYILFLIEFRLFSAFFSNVNIFRKRRFSSGTESGGIQTFHFIIGSVSSMGRILL